MSQSTEHQMIRTEKVPLGDLRAHPKNYRKHPQDQIEHIAASMIVNGMYRPLVIAKDGTLLAGHGVLLAARALGWTEIDVVRLDLAPEDPAALKILTGDNTLSHLAIDDDRLLADLLRDVATADDLMGTGFDEQMLANLVMVTRPASEIADHNEAAHWLGMPDHEPNEYIHNRIRLFITFTSKDDRREVCKKLGLPLHKDDALAWSAKWPPEKNTAREDSSSLMVEG